MYKEQPMAKVSKDQILASYKDIIAEIGKNIGERKRAIATRTFFIMWPYLLLIIGVIYVRYNFTPDSSDFLDIPYILPAIGGYIIFTFVYMTIMASIFEIEKNIWVDSFFDKQKLSTRESWRIAYRLLPRVLSLWLGKMIRFYLPALVIWLAANYFAFQNYGNSPYSYNSPQTIQAQTLAIIVLAVSSGLLAIYTFIVNLRLRFFWFIALDSYGTDHGSISTILEQQGRLSQAAELSGLKRAVTTDLAAGVVDIVTQSAVEVTARTAGWAVGRVNQMAGDMVEKVGEAYGSALASNITSLGQTVAKYILYREARIAAGETAIEVNKNLYDLAQ